MGKSAMSGTCPRCHNDFAESPTGAWCNYCGWQDPCLCWSGQEKECTVHNPHEHIFNDEGKCISGMSCPAKAPWLIQKWKNK